MVELLGDLQFIQRGILAGILAGILCPLLGTFLVVRRLSLIAEALSHVTIAGVGCGLVLTQLVYFLQGFDPLYFGMLFALIGSLFIDRLRSIYKEFQELSIPIVLSAGIGLGVLFISMSNGFNAKLLHFLFGSIASVTRADLIFIVSASIVIILLILLFYKELLSLSFDEEFARISGIPGKLVNLLFTILVAVTISVAMRVVGILLVSSLITIPVATSLRVAKSFKQLIVYALISAQVAVLLGMILGYFLEIATGGMIVMIAVAQLLLVLGWQNILVKQRRLSDER